MKKLTTPKWIIMGLLLCFIFGAGLAVFSSTAEAGTTTPKKIGPNAFGKPVSEWMELYFTWSLWSQVGVEKPDHVGHVTFLPIPVGEYIGGEGTAEDPWTFEGHEDVTLKPGTAFVIPVSCWMGWRYDPETGWPDDLPLDPWAFYGTVEVDGRPMNLSYFEPFEFHPPIPLPPEAWPGISTVYVQGLGFVHEPLSVSTHTITLDSGAIWPAPDYNYGTRYLNTWTITVEP